MPKRNIRIPFKPLNRALSAALFVFIGLSALLLTRAAVPTSHFEAESATVSSNTTVGSDTNASGGKYIVFNKSSVLSCDHTINSTVTTADARTNFSQVQPGDTVCIKSGNRSNLTLKNFHGTKAAPITFINQGGQVVMSGTLQVSYGQHIRVTGTGDPKVKYGIKLNGSVTYGARFNYKTDYWELDHVEIAQARIGLGGNTKPSCPDGSDNDYDYDGDGKITGDLDDAVSAGNYVAMDTYVHDNYFHDIGTEAMYLGNNSVEIKGDPCPDGSKPPASYRDGVFIYNNRLERFGWEGINIKRLQDKPGRCQVHHNVIKDGSMAFNSTTNPGQLGGIHTENSRCDIYNNFVVDQNGPGIRDNGIGGNKIYNNVVARTGLYFPIGDTQGIAAGIVTASGGVNSSLYSVHIFNNSINSPHGNGIMIGDRSNSRVQNNIIANPGSDYLKLRSDTTASNNLQKATVGDVGYVNPASDDYHLTGTSPAVNAGINLSAFGVATDYDDISRPQGNAYDIGAFEYKP